VVVPVPVPDTVVSQLRLTAGPAARPGGPGTNGSGRKTRRTTGSRKGQRVVPTRSEDVLKSAGSNGAGSTWWDRQAAATPGVATLAPVAAVPPAVPVTGGLHTSGLPVRVPMAQLPDADEGTPPSAAPPPFEPDPEAVGSMLSRFYGGVRRAEAEETNETAVARVGPRIDKEQQ
jgi:hypothetical protein